MTTDNQVTENGFTMTLVMHKQNKRGRTVLKTEADPRGLKQVPTGRIPRISRLMALAIHFQKLLGDGVVRDYAEIARLTGVTRARVTQIMNLTLLAPEIQLEILDLKPILCGENQLREKSIKKVYKSPFWEEQIQIWKTVLQSF